MLRRDSGAMDMAIYLCGAQAWQIERFGFEA